jgi:non-specific serine/threonine protein kinase
MTAAAASVRYRFAGFELHRDERRLLADGQKVQLGPHAFDLLVVLVEHGGRLVTKDELLAQVWPKVIVEENTLQAHVSALRKVIGQDAITTVSGRGYRFNLDVAEVGASFSSPGSLIRTNNLPHDFTSFIGRESEIAELSRLMETARLVTVTGAGGCGKTRLAIRVARRTAAAYPDGTWLVELAALNDALLLPHAVAAALDVKLSAGSPAADSLAESMMARSSLLVLDNAEHLIEACAHLVELLLTRCGRLSILVTSRERLAITGEVTYRVPPLSVPDRALEATPERMLGCDSVRLFVERVRLQQPQFAITGQNAPAIASICRRVDGIALALELAAARLRILSAEELNRSLDHRLEVLTQGSRTAPPRHRTLRAMIDWSYELLNAPERAMLRRLSVFAGGWTLEVAERVCGAEEAGPARAHDLLNSLADKSLIFAEIRGDVTRYGMLETIRQYAGNLLREHGEDVEFHRRHLNELRELLRESTKAGLGSDPAWLDRFQTELDNIRAALAWSVSADGDADTGLRLGASLGWFWQVRAPSDGEVWLTRLLAAVPTEDTLHRATALFVSSILAVYRYDLEAAEHLGTQALACSRNLGYLHGIVGSLNTLAQLARQRQDYAAARALHEEASVLTTEAGEPSAIAIERLRFGTTAYESGDLPGARAALLESVATLRELGDWRVAYPLAYLAATEYRAGDLESAKARLDEGLRASLKVRQAVLISELQVTKAWIAHDEGDSPGAREALFDALRCLREDPAPANVCEMLEACAAVACLLDGPAIAARLWGAAERIREKTPCPIPPVLRSQLEREVEAGRAAAGANRAGFDIAWQEGRTMTRDEAMLYASTV